MARSAALILKNNNKNIFLNKKRSIFIAIIALVSLTGSFLLSSSSSDLAVTSAQADENLANSVQENTDLVLSMAEKIGSIPAQTYTAVYPEFNLPKNGPEIIIPVKKNPAADLSVSASSSMVIDKKSGEILWENNSSDIRSIASLTKLMTAFVFLNSDPDWEKIYRLQKEDIRVGGKSYIYMGDEMTVKDLFYLTLIGSDNTAAVALAKSTGLTEGEFIARMNEQAKNFGLKDTFFEDISGLSEKNVSTAKEILTLARKCLAMEKIREATLQENYKFKTVGGRLVTVNSTDFLLSVFPADGVNIVGGKTGYTEEAGYCFVGDFKNEAGLEIISVVMGTRSNEDRFGETKKLVQWSYNNYSWSQSE